MKLGRKFQEGGAMPAGAPAADAPRRGRGKNLPLYQRSRSSGEALPLGTGKRGITLWPLPG